MREAKPRQISCVPSIPYSDFRAAFREIDSDRGSLHRRFGRLRAAKPNKANVAKAFFVNNMTEELAKQTQRTYHASNQLLTAILTPICRKFEWKGCTSLPGISAHGQGLSRRAFQKYSDPQKRRGARKGGFLAPRSEGRSGCLVTRRSHGPSYTKKNSRVRSLQA